MITQRFLLLVVAVGFGAPDLVGAQQATASEEVCRDAAIRQLAALDSRQPVPLLPMMANHQKQNMRDHLLAVQEIVGALAARGFAEKGIHFHRTADRIIEAAHKQDLDATLLAVSETLETCNSCHSMFRQEVVDERPR